MTLDTSFKPKSPARLGVYVGVVAWVFSLLLFFGATSALATLNITFEGAGSSPAFWIVLLVNLMAAAILASMLLAKRKAWGTLSYGIAGTIVSVIAGGIISYVINIMWDGYLTGWAYLSALGYFIGFVAVKLVSKKK